MTHRLAVILLSITSTAACIPMQPGASGPGYTPADPAAVKAQQRAAFAKSMGYPTKKSPQELDQTITVQTAKFKATGRKGSTHLEAPEPFVFDGVNGTCYTVVMHLGAGATWNIGGDYLKFDFQRPEIKGSGGPGVVGPGAVASVGCAKETGPITLTMAPMLEGDPIGTGPIEMQLYSKVLTKAEKQRLEEDEQRQIAEQREFAAREREREARERERSDRESAQRERDRANQRSSSSSSSSGSSSSSSGPVYVTIRSSCGRTVPVFYGDKPKYGSGTTSSVSTNSVSSHSFRVGEMMWVLDDSGNGAGSISIGPNTKNIEIDSSCTRISER